MIHGKNGNGENETGKIGLRYQSYDSKSIKINYTSDNNIL